MLTFRALALCQILLLTAVSIFLFQPTSLRSSDEIKFKTIIPASSLVVRDHCWLNDGM